MWYEVCGWSFSAFFLLDYLSLTSLSIDLSSRIKTFIHNYKIKNHKRKINIGLDRGVREREAGTYRTGQ